MPTASEIIRLILPVTCASDHDGQQRNDPMNKASCSIARPSDNAHLVYFGEEADCLTVAAQMLKAAGFYHYQTSLRSEAAYYKFPGRSEVLRLSSHPRNKGKTLYGLNVVASCLTINFRGGTTALRATDIENRVAMAIGYFFLRSTSERGGTVDTAGLNLPPKRMPVRVRPLAPTEACVSDDASPQSTDEERGAPALSRGNREHCMAQAGPHVSLPAQPSLRGWEEDGEREKATN